MRRDLCRKDSTISYAGIRPDRERERERENSAVAFSTEGAEDTPALDRQGTVRARDKLWVADKFLPWGPRMEGIASLRTRNKAFHTAHRKHSLQLTTPTWSAESISGFRKEKQRVQQGTLGLSAMRTTVTSNKNASVTLRGPCESEYAKKRNKKEKKKIPYRQPSARDSSTHKRNPS